tara:strand:- start:1036 stop:1197 length:162 start_codon:yes stop_codon:yes gene_type:complete
VKTSWSPEVENDPPSPEPRFASVPSITKKSTVQSFPVKKIRPATRCSVPSARM